MRKFWFGAIVVLFNLALATSAQAGLDVSVTTHGCFNRTTNTATNTYTLRMSTPSCTIVATNSGATNDAVVFLIENIDPDFVTVDNYDTVMGITKTDNTLQFTKTISSGAEETIVIEPWYEYGDEFYFVAISDNQAWNTVDVNPIFETIINQINVVNPVFYTNSGDMVQGSSNRETMEQMYDAVLNALGNSMSPMYPIAGNHDYGSGLDVFSEYFGVDDYTFDFANTQFTGLSTVSSSSKGSVDDESLVWLDNTLSSSDKSHKIVFFHHPLVRPDWSENEYCCFVNTNERDALAGVVDENDGDIAIVGHSHGYDYRFLTSEDVSTITNGFYQLITAGAGGTLAQPDGVYHFTLVHVTPDEIEHTVIEKNDFDTVVEYSDNDGSEDAVTAEVNNSSNTDLPYVRLKFKVNNNYDSFLVSDDEGNYYNSYYTHSFADYTVIYLDTEAVADSTAVYTVRPATIIHKDTINTVKTTGLVSYSEQPETTTTALDFGAVSGKKTTQISNIVWGDADAEYARSWREVPTVKKSNTTYTLSNLPPNRLFSITVNDTLYQKMATNKQGVLQFTYTPNKADRQFSVKMLDTLYPSSVALVPYSNGTPHVRRFTGDGVNLTNWFALQPDTSGSYNIVQADVDGDRAHEVIVSSGVDTGGQVTVYTIDGEKLAGIYPFGKDYTGGVIVKTGDLTGDHQSELIMIPQSGDARIKVYRYKTNSQKLILLDTIKPYGSNYQASFSVAVGNLDNTTKHELAIIGVVNSGETLKIYGLNNNRQLKLKSRKRIVAQYEHISLAIGEFGKAGQTRLALYLNSADGGDDRISMYRLTSEQRLKTLNHTWLNLSLGGVASILAGDIDQSDKDHIILSSASDPRLAIYRVTKVGKVKERLTQLPFGESYHGGIIATLIDIDDNWDVELVTAMLAGTSEVRVWNYRPKQSTLHSVARWYGYDEEFSGGTNLSL